MRVEYKIIVGIFTVLGVWISLYLANVVLWSYGLASSVIIPFPYLFYVVWWYYDNMGLFGIVIVFSGIAIFTARFIEIQKSVKSKKVEETLAEKRP